MFGPKINVWESSGGYTKIKGPKSSGGYKINVLESSDGF